LIARLEALSDPNVASGVAPYVISDIARSALAAINPDPTTSELIRAALALADHCQEPLHKYPGQKLFELSEAAAAYRAAHPEESNGA
jgi:hypothetical protein